MSITANLSELKTEPEFLTITHRATAESSTYPALSAVWSTLSLLSQSSCIPDQVAFLPPYLSLVLSSSTNNLKSISYEEGKFVKDLTHAAHVTSTLLSCSSVLAGFSSDSDQFGDVGILLPILKGDRETEIINLLGLAHWLRSGGKVCLFYSRLTGTPEHHGSLISYRCRLGCEDRKISANLGQYARWTGKYNSDPKGYGCKSA